MNIKQLVIGAMCTLALSADSWAQGAPLRFEDPRCLTGGNHDGQAIDWVLQSARGVAASLCNNLSGVMTYDDGQAQPSAAEAPRNFPLLFTPRQMKSSILGATGVGTGFDQRFTFLSDCRFQSRQSFFLNDPTVEADLRRRLTGVRLRDALQLNATVVTVTTVARAVDAPSVITMRATFDIASTGARQATCTYTPRGGVLKGDNFLPQERAQ